MAEKFAKDTVRICADIAKERHDIVKKYNDGNIRPISLTTVAKLAIEKAIDDLEIEIAEKKQK